MQTIDNISQQKAEEQILKNKIIEPNTSLVKGNAISNDHIVTLSIIAKKNHKQKEKVSGRVPLQQSQQNSSSTILENPMRPQENLASLQSTAKTQEHAKPTSLKRRRGKPLLPFEQTPC